MAVMLHRAVHTSRQVGLTFDTPKLAYQQDVKAGLDFEVSPRQAGGKQILFAHADDYLYVSSPAHAVNSVDVTDAQVPEFSSDSSSILDLSSGMTPTLDTPSIIDSIVDVLPFRFLGNNPSGAAPDPVPPPGDIVSTAAASAMLGIQDPVDTFQDLSPLINDPTMSMVSSPGPMLSPAGSNYSDVSTPSGSSPASLVSAASTSNDTHRFFAPDFEVTPAFVQEQRTSSIRLRDLQCEMAGPSRSLDRYSEMRKKNNIASRRSRLTRREKEREMEQQLKALNEENVTLKTRVKNLEELVENTKRIIIQVVTNRQQPQP